MDIRRMVLYTALALVIYSLWTNWQKDYPAPVTAIAEQSAITEDNQALLPELSTEKSPVLKAKEMPVKSKTANLITVKTDVFSIEIDPAQGDIVQASLLNYPVSVDQPQKPIDLLYDNSQARYVANSSLLTSINKKTESLTLNYQSATDHYELENGANELKVVLTGEGDNGLKVNKIFTFNRDSYVIQVTYELANEGATTWDGFMNTQLLRSAPQEESSSMFQIGSYTGASFSIPGKQRYKKVSFKDMGKANLNVTVDGGWVAMQQHYFLTAWVPDKSTNNIFYTRFLNGDYTIGAVTQSIELQPGKETTIKSHLYIGPENTAVLSALSPGLELTVDYGWLWFLSSALFSVMRAIYSVVQNWGWSIVLVTVLIKLLFYRLSASSYKSMAGMRKLQPKLLALRERYGDDKAKMSQATMELYRQEKVNPLGGCLPVIIQIPVFIALYWVLIESVELRQAPFIFWIKDLAIADPYHVLPIIMGATMLIQQRLNPAPPDPMQAKVMMFLPVLFTALFWNFPAGLVLYWIVNNTLSILQQWYITRKYSETPVKKSKAQIIPAK